MASCMTMQHHGQHGAAATGGMCAQCGRVTHPSQLAAPTSRCLCSHQPICRDCLAYEFTRQIETHAERFVCPLLGCSNVLKISELKAFVPAAVFARLIARTPPSPPKPQPPVAAYAPQPPPPPQPMVFSTTPSSPNARLTNFIFVRGAVNQAAPQPLPAASQQPFDSLFAPLPMMPEHATTPPAWIPDPTPPPMYVVKQAVFTPPPASDPAPRSTNPCSDSDSFIRNLPSDFWA